MDNRNVKIVDENNIDREGKVICGFSNNGNNYALIFINRDEELDSLFVTREVKKLDGTSNLVEFDDANEKEIIDGLAKKLIQYAVHSDDDILNSKTVSIDGKDININNVVFNKEQHLNISKSYVTAVKRSACKVAFDYFKTNELTKNDEEIFSNNENSIFANFGAPIETPASEDIPGLVNAVTEPMKENNNDGKLSNVEPVVEETPVLEVPESLISEPVSKETTDVIPSEVEPVLPNIAPVSVVPQVEKEAAPVLPIHENDNEVVSNPVKDDEVKTEPVPISPVSVISSVSPVNSISSEPQLFFDGSKETNLNKVLGEENVDKVVKTEDSGVESLREFGTSDKTLSVENDSSVNSMVQPEHEKVKTLSRSKGFANNKFFTVIAIILFLAACAFLGYEAFQYFTMK